MKKLFIITGTVLAVLLVSGKLLDRCYKKYWGPFFEKLDMVFKDRTYYDGIYLGDSRVHFGINPQYVDSINGIKTYNMGLGGAPITEVWFLTKSYLRNHPAPKFAVISVGYSNLLNRNRFFENPCYYFFYTADTAVSRQLQQLNYHVSLYKMLPVLKYTAFDDFNKFSIAENIKGHTILKPGGIMYRGFINNTTNSFNMKEIEEAVQTDTACYKGIQLLEETIRLFTENNTIPVLVYPPATHRRHEAKNALESRLDTVVAGLARKYNAPLLHYDTDSAFTDALFTDGWHLNINGTILYSKKLGNDLKTVLK